MSIGAAASKTAPLTIDAVEYYNRVIGFPPTADPTATPPVPEYVSPWGVSFVRSENPDDPGTEMTTGERLVNYDSFTYNRSQTFKGSVTWLDVSSLKWKVSKITDVVPFTNLSDSAIGTRTLTGVTAFAQLADDVRALCNFIPDNTFIPGFFMDVPGVDTTAAQQRAIVDPAVDVGTLPEDVFQTASFPVTASLLNPWGGTLIPDAQLRITIDAPQDFTGAGDVTAAATGSSAGQSVPFALVDGNLVGRWGPDGGFPVEPGYNVSTTFDVTVADGSPVGDYTVTLDLIRTGDPGTVLAAEAGTIAVHANEATVLWGTPLPRLVTQGVSATIPLRVYSPEAGSGRLALTVAGPGDDPTTEQTEVTEAGDVKIYASNGTDMVAMPLTLNDAGNLVGTWDATLVAGFNPVSWYATVATGALVGNYAFGVSLAGGNTLSPIVVSVSAPESHGEKPPGAGEDTTAPVVTVTAVDELGSTAAFTLAANEESVTFECRLTTNTVTAPWESCTSPTTYSGLEPGDYAFSARATDAAGNVSAVVTKNWVVIPPDTTAPVVTVTPDGVLGSTASFTFTADEDSATFECQLTKDGTVTQAWAPCTSPKTYSGLAAGTYLFSARATDDAGNVSSLATKSWTVKAPVVTTQSKDFNGDGKADVLARDTLGQLWLYPGNGRGGWLPRVRVGTGWNIMTALVGPGDFNGDAKTDVLARDTLGQLWLYPGNGRGGWLPRVRVGTGWNIMTALVGPGDFNGDAKTDVLARDTLGQLWLYPGNGRGGWLPRVRVGTGWNIMTALVGPGDFNGDAKTVVLARHVDPRSSCRSTRATVEADGYRGCASGPAGTS